MSVRKTEFAPGEYYHVYNRGNSKQIIFLEDADRDRFLKLLYLSNSKNKIDFREDIVKKKIDAWDYERGDCLVKIAAWVLMPNHFHLYISSTESTDQPEARLPAERSNITLFVHKLLTAYSKYFNAKYTRTGALFEGKFKSVHINNDRQAKYLFAYIHLNPLKLINSQWRNVGIDKNQAMKFLTTYFWSSFQDYAHSPARQESKILSKDFFAEFFDSTESVQNEIFDWITYNDTAGSLASGWRVLAA
jgi:putative transposase